ncbi:hypothetical protein [Paractinoplanes toevensis]|uniref:Uncharacterized protein n=1 Tax=Paractinoplanes toevensis TaxID=571911 RepID=A0A919W209_9ACTN|nr:hypothetical protein [Actinoplanes toevensis]GIM91054.1 hypothetical protein Ato02nite_028470 [Actinoplanes toevensis]
MLITFARAAGGSTLATVRRADGVVLELPGFDRKWRVPHDLAHAATECELGMSEGVFGSIAGGGVFGNMRVVGGKPRHDAADRSRRLLAANKRPLGVAEVLAGVVHDAVEHGRPAVPPELARGSWGIFSSDPFPWSPAQLSGAVRRLAGLAAEFERSGGALEFAWPDRLTSPVPAPAAPRRGRRGRV